MSFYKKNIRAFIRIIEQQGSLFSEQEKAELNALSNTFTENLQQISKLISDWYETDTRPHILKAQLESLMSLPIDKSASTSQGDESRGFGFITPPPLIPETDPETDKLLRQELVNAIRRLTSKPSPSQRQNHDKDKKSSD